MNFDYEKHKKIIILIIYSVLIITGLYFSFVKLIPIMAPFIVALITAILISPLVNLLNNKLKINRSIACIISILISFTVIAGIVSFAANEVYSFFEGILKDLFLNNDTKGLSIISEKINEITRRNIDLVAAFKSLLSPIMSWSFGFAKTIASNVPSAFVASIVFILSTYFILSDKERILKFFFKILGDGSEERINDFKMIAKNSVIKYIKAQLIILCITFTELLIGFFIMKLLKLSPFKYIILLSLGIAILDTLPIFGTGTVLIPWSLYEIVIARFDFALYLIILYIVCLLVRQLVEPKIVGKSLGLHPLVTLISIYVGLKLLGVFGMILLPIITLFIVQLHRLGALNGIKNFLK